MYVAQDIFTNKDKTKLVKVITCKTSNSLLILPVR